MSVHVSERENWISHGLCFRETRPAFSAFSQTVELAETQTSGHQMDQEPLRQQHLPAAQHAAPAAVCGQRGALQLREVLPVGQPNPGHESQTEALHLV